MKKIIGLSAIVIGATLVALPARALDYKLSDEAFVSLYTTAYLSATTGGDDQGLFARIVSEGTFNYQFSDGISVGAKAKVQGFSNYDKYIRNIGQGPHGELWTGIGYISGIYGDVVAGKTFGAVSEMLDQAPSAIGPNYGVWEPWFIHVRRPGFAPESPTTSPDFRESTPRVGFYSPNHDGFQFAVTYAPKIESMEPAALTTVHSKDAFDVAVAYKGYIQDATFRIAGGYQAATAEILPINALTAADQSHFSGSAKIDWRGFTLSGGVMYTENTLGLRNLDNISYNAGLMYAWGLYQVSVSYGASTDLYPRDCGKNPWLCGTGNAKMNILELAASYRVTPNSSLGVAAMHVNYDDKIIGAGVANSGEYGVVQYSFTF